MNQPIESDAILQTISIHEVGHLVVGMAFDRTPQKVTVIFENGIRGCFWQESDDSSWSSFQEICSLLSGPRAQVEILPSSIPSDRLHCFDSRIIQPATDPRTPPVSYYDFTGWEFDVIPVYKMLVRQTWPASGRDIPFGTSIESVWERAEDRLLELFRIPDVQECVRTIAKPLFENRSLDGSTAASAVNNAGVLSRIEAQGLLDF